MSQLRIPRKSRRPGPCLPLVTPELEKPHKTDLVVFKLRLDPTQADSEKFEKSCRRFQSGEASTWIDTLLNIQEIFVRNDVIDAEFQMAICHAILYGDARTQFDARLDPNGLILMGTAVTP